MLESEDEGLEPSASASASVPATSSRKGPGGGGGGGDDMDVDVDSEEDKEMYNTSRMTQRQAALAGGVEISHMQLGTPLSFFFSLYSMREMANVG